MATGKESELVWAKQRQEQEKKGFDVGNGGAGSLAQSANQAEHAR